MTIKSICVVVGLTFAAAVPAQAHCELRYSETAPMKHTGGQSEGMVLARGGGGHGHGGHVSHGGGGGRVKSWGGHPVHCPTSTASPASSTCEQQPRQAV